MTLENNSKLKPNAEHTHRFVIQVLSNDGKFTHVRVFKILINVIKQINNNVNKVKLAKNYYLFDNSRKILTLLLALCYVVM